MPVIDVVIMVIVVCIVAIVPPIAILRTMRTVPFSGALKKSANDSSRRLEKYRRTTVTPTAFPRWYRVLPLLAVIGVLLAAIGVPFAKLVLVGRFLPVYFPNAIAVLPAGVEYVAAAVGFCAVIFALLLAEPVLMRVFPRTMTYLSALSLVNNPLVRVGKKVDAGGQHATIERIASTFDLIGYSAEYLRARVVGFAAVLVLGTFAIVLAAQHAIVVNEQGFVFRQIIGDDVTWAWSDVKEILIGSTQEGDDGVAPEFIVSTAKENRDIWSIDSLTRIGNELIAICDEARARNIPIIIDVSAERVLQLPLTANDNARVLDACASR